MLRIVLSLCVFLQAFGALGQSVAFNKHRFYIPQNLAEANEQLDRTLTAKARAKFKALNESDLENVSGIFVVGEWDGEGSRFVAFLSRYMNPKQHTWGYLDWQVRNHLIYLSYLRHLNNQPFDLAKETSRINAKADSVTQVDERRKQRNILADSINGVYIPQNLKDSFRRLDEMLSDTLKQKLRHPDPEYGLAEFHFNLGLWMRNSWQLWGGSRLQQYFEGLGVHHPDDMSGIILRTYSEHLNGKILDEASIKPLTVPAPTDEQVPAEPLIYPEAKDDGKFYTKEYRRFLRKRRIDDFQSLPPEAYAE
ncbi:hypothetical protein KB206_14120 [Microvirga sp. STS02]|uniref:DUF6794 domain-containing protein n=1 Tax=Hymenobacter negativus TaxID=2795026 RepID=UPI0018DD5003|nr:MULTISPECIES: DUF6794 domain-containing protein [Bacteria]MBH8570022.1 hypothetical protein [Hymenobacter negativus]MBR7209762.1 hypothetical protein [Microvirga sp. STS02]